MMRREVYKGCFLVLLIGTFGVLISDIQSAESGIEAGEALTLQQGSDSINFTPGSTLYLEPNAPNPFGSEKGTIISFSLNEEAVVSLSVYDCFYNLVEILIDEKTMDEGRYPVSFNPGLRIASGMYFYTLEIKNGERLTRRMLYIR